MASYVFYPGDGAQTDWSVPFPYLSKDHVKVTVGGVATTFAWLNTSLLRVSPAPTAGVVVLVQRVTQKTPMTVFENTNNLTAENLTLAETQALFIAEEASDRASLSIAIDNASGQYGFQGRRATNVADPVDPQDAATKNYADTAMSSQLAQATSQKDQAVTARVAAEAARDTANAKATQTTNDAATVAADKAVVIADMNTVATNMATVQGYTTQTAADRTATAADRVQTGQDRTATGADRTQTGADRTAVANDKATVAANLTAAQAARTGAESAQTAAAASADLSQKWANNPVDVVIADSKYSAYHWAVKAQALVTGGVTASTVPFTPAGTVNSTNVQDAIVEVATEAQAAADNALTQANNAANVKLDKAGGTMTGDLSFDRAVGNGLNLRGKIAGKDRWVLQLGNGVAEGGSNAGSDFGLLSYNDDGTFLRAPIQIVRASGAVTLSGSVSAAGIASTNDVHTHRGNATGAYYFGSGDQSYLYFDGTNINCPSWLMSPRGVRYADTADGYMAASTAYGSFVTGIRGVYAGDWNWNGSPYGWNEIGNAWITGYYRDPNDGTEQHRYRYIQYCINGGWYTAGWAS